MLDARCLIRIRAPSHLCKLCVLHKIHDNFGDDMCQAKALAAWVAKAVLRPILPAPAADSEPAWWPRER